LTMEAWVFPNSEESGFGGLFGTWERGLVYYKSSGRLLVTKNGTNYVWTSLSLVLGEWNHVALVYGKDRTLDLYANGQKETFSEVVHHPEIERTLSIGNISGNFFNGFIDEFRLWSVAHDSATIVKDKKRYLSGNEDNLEVYHRFNMEDSKSYDRSRKSEGGILVWNQNDGDYKGSPTFASKSPSKNDIGYKGYTDEEGDYRIEGIVYKDLTESFQGQVFNIYPKRGVDEFFGPSQLSLGSLTTLRSNVDFANESNTKVSGNISYDQNVDGRVSGSVGAIPSANVEILVDGKSTNPKTITDSFGNYSVIVPMGKHVVRPYLPRHIFQYTEKPEHNAFYDFYKSKDTDGDGIVDTLGYSFSAGTPVQGSRIRPQAARRQGAGGPGLSQHVLRWDVQSGVPDGLHALQRRGRYRLRAGLSATEDGACRAARVGRAAADAGIANPRGRFRRDGVLRLVRMGLHERVDADAPGGAAPAGRGADPSPSARTHRWRGDLRESRAARPVRRRHRGWGGRGAHPIAGSGIPGCLGSRRSAAKAGHRTGFLHPVVLRRPVRG